MSSIRNPKGTHHAEHEPGGIDALVTLDGGILLTGTIPDARHSSNVPLKNVANTFSANQVIGASSPAIVLNDTAAPADARQFVLVDTIQKFEVRAVNDAFAILATPLSLARNGDATVGGNLSTGRVILMSGTNPFIGLTPTNGTVDARAWLVQANGTGQVVIRAYNDAFTAPGSAWLQVDRNTSVLTLSGDICEKQRTTPMGHWVGYTPTWTTVAGTINGSGTATSYMLVGKTMFLSVYGAIVLGGTPGTSFAASLPIGFTTAATAATGISSSQPAGSGAAAQTVNADTKVSFYRDLSGINAWAAGTFYVGGCAVIPIV